MVPMLYYDLWLVLDLTLTNYLFKVNLFSVLNQSGFTGIVHVKIDA